MRFAAVMAAVTLTSFEVLRAAVACRVDMVLTACIVVGLYQMYLLRENFSTLRAVGTVLLLSGAVLTKGPVGALLPCLAMGIFCLIMRDNFFKTAAWLGRPLPGVDDHTGDMVLCRLCPRRRGFPAPGMGGKHRTAYRHYVV